MKEKGRDKDKVSKAEEGKQRETGTHCRAKQHRRDVWEGVVMTVGWMQGLE